LRTNTKEPIFVPLIHRVDEKQLEMFFFEKLRGSPLNLELPDSLNKQALLISDRELAYRFFFEFDGSDAQSA